MKGLIFGWVARLRFRKQQLSPDIQSFHQDLLKAVDLHRHDSSQVAIDFRRLFLRDPELGKRVLFMLLTWCGEYDVSNDDDDPVPPLDRDKLQRWAGKREIAGNIKAALYADLTPTERGTNVQD